MLKGETAVQWNPDQSLCGLQRAKSPAALNLSLSTVLALSDAMSFIVGLLLSVVLVSVVGLSLSEL